MSARDRCAVLVASQIRAGTTPGTSTWRCSRRTRWRRGPINWPVSVPWEYAGNVRVRPLGAVEGPDRARDGPAPDMSSARRSPSAGPGPIDK